MFQCDYKDLVLAFNAFHDVKNGDMPEYGSFCLLELKDGRLTGGSWYPKNYQKKNADGQFIRGTADTVPAEDVAKWHALEQYDLSECLQDENIGRINFKEGKRAITLWKSGISSPSRTGDTQRASSIAFWC